VCVNYAYFSMYGLYNIILISILFRLNAIFYYNSDTIIKFDWILFTIPKQQQRHHNHILCHILYYNIFKSSNIKFIIFFQKFYLPPITFDGIYFIISLQSMSILKSCTRFTNIISFELQDKANVLAIKGK